MKNKINSIIEKIENCEPIRVYGEICEVIGLTIKSYGPPASIGEILTFDDKNIDIPLQVIGFDGKKTLSMPLGEVRGIYPGLKVFSQGKEPNIKFDNNFLGRVINGMGKIIDKKGELQGKNILNLYKEPVNAMERENINKVFSTGVKAIDGMISIGKGQRIGIFAGSGVGKSTLMGMIAKNTNTEVNVIALIGERGRELKDFLEKNLGEEGLKKTIVVTATSDEPPLLKIIACYTATAIAEYFCDQGKDVLLMMDSLTRIAMAQREVGLSSGEPPSTKGYTPSVFAQMPKLLERAGNFAGKGSITGIYTVLVEGDDVNEPVSDHARSILDGHIVLSREIAHRNHFPAIDVLGSISRVMPDIVSQNHLSAAGQVRELLAIYKEAEDLINIGAYVKGSNLKIDRAVDKIDLINHFLRQKTDEKSEFEQTIKKLEEIINEKV